MNEFDTMKAVDELLTAIDDSSEKERVIDWLLMKHGGKKIKRNPAKVPKRRASPSKKKTKAASLKISIIKDLNLRPKGKKSLREFVEEKRPSSHSEKITVAVYYLAKELDVSAITPSHVYSCYQDAKWRNPADLWSAMRKYASLTGWIDTSNSSNVTITPPGENLVNHDLPKQKPSKS